jgi:hypothetical protein
MKTSIVVAGEMSAGSNLTRSVRTQLGHNNCNHHGKARDYDDNCRTAQQRYNPGRTKFEIQSLQSFEKRSV